MFEISEKKKYSEYRDFYLSENDSNLKWEK